MRKQVKKSLAKMLARSLPVVLTASVLSVWPYVSTEASASSQAPATQQDHPVTGGVAQKTLAAKSDHAASVLKGEQAQSWSTDTGIVTTGQDPTNTRALTPKLRAAEATQTPAKVTVQVLDHAKATAARVQGVLVKLSQDSTAAKPTTVSLNYSSFAKNYGGDWAQRLQLVQLPNCAVTTPQLTQCQQQTPLTTQNNAKAKTVTAKVATANAVVAAVAADSSPSGSYAATSLASSASWSVDGNSGNFAWSYPLSTPTVPGGLAPSVSLAYSSQAVDGHTAATNNQPSWVGEGWDLQSGFVERSYRTCSDNGGTTADQCWAGDNATVQLNGHSSRLLYDDATKTWKPQTDHGEKVEHLTGAVNGDNDGEYWRITTNDGVQYYFGVNRIPGWASGNAETNSTWTVPVFGKNAGEPCNGSTFATSVCDQAWRWNLDYVVDPHGNSMMYYYNKETNTYGENNGATNATYVRGGTLAKIDYGMRAGSEFTGQAQAEMVFSTADRCVSGSACSLSTAANFPDVPTDQICSGTCSTSQRGPTFFSTKRLSTVLTQAWNGTKFAPVDSWQLDQTFPDPGDGGAAALWLHGITHTGKVGGVDTAMPEVTFVGNTFDNRVDSPSDGLTAMPKYRVTAIENETGGEINVTFANKNCSYTALPTAETNGLRCFPEYWTPKGGQPFTDWFHKYVVAQITQNDKVGGNKLQVTNYTYNGDAAWHYSTNPTMIDKYKSWNEWRGYGSVTQSAGDPTNDPVTKATETKTTYFRGMNGDHLSSGTRSVSVTDSQGVSVVDDDQLSGAVRETIVDNGAGGSMVSDGITDFASVQTSTQGSQHGFMVHPVKSVGRTALSSGGVRTTESDTTYNSDGLPTQVSDLGDTSIASDDRCTTTTYAQNRDKWMLTGVSEVAVVGVKCDGTPSYPADALVDTRTSYDGQAFGSGPAIGDVTKVELATSYSGSTPTFTTQGSAVFDSYGRSTSSTDVLGNVTKTAYTPATGIATSVAVTNSKSWVTTTTMDVERNEKQSIVDQNGSRTDVVYDSLGRVVMVYAPGASKSGGSRPTSQYSYTISNTKPSVVETDNIGPNLSYLIGYTYYDGFLRKRQTQTAGDNSGRVLTDTYYNSAGQQNRSNGAYDDTSSPGTGLTTISDNLAPSHTDVSFDGAGRTIASIFSGQGIEKWRTTTAYGGDHVDVTPPSGGTATTTFADARGQTTELRQYHGTSPTGSYDATKYAYTKSGKQASIVDAAGNQWTYSYDILGNLVSSTDPDKGASSATYDAVGKALTTTDSRGKTLSYTYDELGRQTAQYDGTTQTTANQLSGWTYDTVLKGYPASSVSYTSGVAAVTKSVTAYDTFNRPTTSVIKFGAFGDFTARQYSTTSTYNTDGSVRTVAMPGLSGATAETLTYGYDNNGLPSTLTGKPTGSGLTPTTYVKSMSYSNFGQPLLETLGDDGAHVWVSNFYDDATGRLQESMMDKDKTSTSNGTTFADYNYSYNASGNVTAIADTATAGGTDNQCFSYDYLSRLTNAWTSSTAPTVTGGLANASSSCTGTPSTSTIGGAAPYWQSFGYDVTGNRISKTDHATVSGGTDTVQTESYPATGAAQPHAVSSNTVAVGTSSRTDTYAYDSAGNTTSRSVNGSAQTLTWNSMGKLATDVTTNAAGTQTASDQYLYDADGNMVGRRDDVGTTLYVGNAELYKVRTAATASGVRFYSFAGQTIATRTLEGITGLAWSVGDQHGTQSVQVKADTLAVTKRWLDPFGASRGTAASAWIGDHGFVNGVTDDSSGLTILGARDYDASLGRFVSVDPVLSGDPQQMNGYSYANNSPEGSSDPTGLEPKMDYCKNASSSVCDNYYYSGVEASTQGTVSNYTMKVVEACTWEQSCMESFGHKSTHVSASQLNDIRSKHGLGFAPLVQVASAYVGIDDVISFSQHPSWSGGAWVAFDVASDLLPFLKPFKLLKMAKGADALVDSEKASDAARVADGVDAASNVANGPRLGDQLTRAQAESLFTPDGGIKPEVIGNSKPIMEATKLGNKDVTQAMIDMTGSLDGWAKWSTDAMTPQGKAQLHFYYNQVSRQFLYYDYKFKLSKGVK